MGWMKLPNLWVIFWGVLIVLFQERAYGYRIETFGGGYSFTATNSKNNSRATLSGIGSYRLGFRFSIFNQIEGDLGYSILATDVVGGDLSFGADLGFSYFPWTVTGDLELNRPEATLTAYSRWHPLIGFGFSQRNFQSVSSQYAGAHLKVGLEYQGWRQMRVGGFLRYIMLNGPSNSTATQIDILGGIVTEF